jgi:secretory phospholipase A2
MARLLIKFLLLSTLLFPVLSIQMVDNLAAGGISKFLKKLGEAFGSLLDCSYSCPNGGYPAPIPGYVPKPNGCGTAATMFTKELSQFLPSVHECCSHHDTCYGTCNAKRNSCDKKFRKCLKDICVVAKKLIKVAGRKFDVEELCNGAANALFAVVAGAGCDSYRSAQKEACQCVAGVPEL